MIHQEEQTKQLLPFLSHKDTDIVRPSIELLFCLAKPPVTIEEARG
jgi:hypothetical protein